MCHLTILTSKNRSSTFPHLSNGPRIFLFSHTSHRLLWKYPPPQHFRLIGAKSSQILWGSGFWILVPASRIVCLIFNFSRNIWPTIFSQSSIFLNLHFIDYFSNFIGNYVSLIVILRRNFSPNHFSSHHTVMLWVLAITSCYERNVVGNAAGTFKLRPAASKIRP